jgi:hypothetical protein
VCTLHRAEGRVWCPEHWDGSVGWSMIGVVHEVRLLNSKLLHLHLLSPHTKSHSITYHPPQNQKSQSPTPHSTTPSISYYLSNKPNCLHPPRHFHPRGTLFLALNTENSRRGGPNQTVWDRRSGWRARFACWVVVCLGRRCLGGWLLLGLRPGCVS